ncbi:MAG TPA: hypothetical protein VKB57_08675 [Acidimicrobiales bacterium]|nr:hypothetical protein [Acidimicrobiales bacterium]
MRDDLAALRRSPGNAPLGNLSGVPIVVELRTERGEVVRALDDPSGGTFDASGDFDRLLPDDGMLLRYIDEYGDTVFNRLQMNDLIRDVDRLAARADLKPIERRGLDRLRPIATTCRDETHLYVWSIGD